jgi:hypothetical protein
MSIKIDFGMMPGYIHIGCTGIYSFNEAKRVYKIAVDTASGCSKSRILIDVFGVTGNASALERYDLSVFLAEYINEYAPDKITRFAVTGHEPPLDKNRFGMFIARSLGINIHVTTDLTDAIAWITM